jgi:hypothetical protein
MPPRAKMVSVVCMITAKMYSNTNPEEGEPDANLLSVMLEGRACTAESRISGTHSARSLA